MKNRVFLFLFLGAVSAAAQVSPMGDYIDKASVERAVLEGRFTSTPQPQNYSGGSVVSAAELSVPPRAKKEFDKGNEAFEKGDFIQARNRLSKAISLYAKSAGAYNNLAVVCARLGDHESEREALEKALDLDDRFALAYLNWGRMEIAGSNFREAESAFSKATALDQNDSTAAMLLAYSQFMQGNLQPAVANSLRAHKLGKPHVFAHRIAAYSFVHLGQFDRAADELKLAIEEDPSGLQGKAARKEMEQLRAMSR